MAEHNVWSETEDDMLRTFFPRHGKDWVGWGEVLSGRSDSSILHRARTLGIAPVPRERPKPANPDPRHKPREYELEPDPHESYVVECMHMGMTPSEIDASMHWRRGTARLIMSNRWLREKREFENGGGR